MMRWVEGDVSDMTVYFTPFFPRLPEVVINPSYVYNLDMGLFSISKPKIIILDDDHYPEGRVSEKLMPEFKYRHLDIEVKHYRTFASLSEAINRGDITKLDLLVLDSTLDDEPDGHRLEFGQTVPALLDMGIKPKHMMPGSGGREGTENNKVFEEIIERRGRQMDWQQMDLSGVGLSGNPLTAADKILDYFYELNPKFDIERELVGESIPRR